MPSVAFTLPPIAAVGLSEAAARAAGGYKTLMEEGSGRIFGAHLVGPHVDEVINLFALAVRRDLTAEDLRKTIFAYPTGASDIGSML